jgi:hypothetical protein
MSLSRTSVRSEARTARHSTTRWGGLELLLGPSDCIFVTIAEECAMRYEVPVFVDRVRPIFTHPVMVLRVWNTVCPVTDSVGVSGERRRVSAGMRY